MPDGFPMCLTCIDSYTMPLPDTLYLGACCASCGSKFHSPVYFMPYTAVDKFNEEATDNGNEPTEDSLA